LDLKLAFLRFLSGQSTSQVLDTFLNHWVFISQIGEDHRVHSFEDIIESDEHEVPRLLLLIRIVILFIHAVYWQHDIADRDEQPNNSAW